MAMNCDETRSFWKDLPCKTTMMRAFGHPEAFNFMDRKVN